MKKSQIIIEAAKDATLVERFVALGVTMLDLDPNEIRLRVMRYVSGDILIDGHEGPTSVSEMYEKYKLEYQEALAKMPPPPGAAVTDEQIFQALKGFEPTNIEGSS